MKTIVHLLLASCASVALAADVSLSNQSAAPGSSVVVPAEFASQGGLVSAIQFDVQYDSSVMNLMAVPGDAARNSGKSLFYADVTPNLRRFLIVGVNRNSMADGALIELFVNLNQSAPDGNYALTISNVQGADPAGIAVAGAGVGGVITIQGNSAQSAPLQQAGVLNAASLVSVPVAPGEIVTLLGSGIGPASAAQPSNAPSSLGLNGTSVMFDGAPAPLLYAGLNQINLVVPSAVAGEISTQVRIVNSNQLLAALSVPVAASAPGIFTLDSSGSGPGVIANADWTINTPANPAARGSQAALYATGAGLTNPPGIDGQLPGSRLPAPVLPVFVQVGGTYAQVMAAGASPDSINGVLQVIFVVPATVAPGSSVPVTLTVGTITSPSGVTIAVQ